MNRSVKLFIGDIAENMRLIPDLIKGMDYDGFVKDKRTNYAVLRCIEVIGEASKNVPPEIRSK
jgi:uncharacterized protein with HEPN domain